MEKYVWMVWRNGGCLEMRLKKDKRVFGGMFCGFVLIKVVMCEGLSCGMSLLRFVLWIMEFESVVMNGSVFWWLLVGDGVVVVAVVMLQWRWWWWEALLKGYILWKMF